MAKKPIPPSAFQKWKKRMWDRCAKLWRWLIREFSESPIAASIVLLLLLLILALVSPVVWPTLNEGYGQGVFVEFHGMLLDILVFGILIAVYARLIERRRRVERQQEIIDDYKKWDIDEARYRIAGAIRRLNRLGKTDIDFGGIELRDFAFRYHDICSIRGSTFYDGSWGTMGSRDQVKLEKIDFGDVDCRAVIFSRFNPFQGLGLATPALINDCNFQGADLRGAVFNGAYLEWTMTHPEELGYVEEDEEGRPHWIEAHASVFGGAQLAGATFSNAIFKNADFRNADGILACDFRGATGLETCLFDDEKVKKAIIESAKVSTQCGT